MPSVSSASASELTTRKGWYGSLVGGYSRYDSAKARTSNGIESEVNLSAGYRALASLGYDYGKYRYDVEVSYQQFGIDSTEAEDNLAKRATSGQSNVLTAMINGYYDFDSVNEVTPYIGLGVGLAHTTLNNYYLVEDDYSIEDYDVVFGGQVIAGLSYPIAKTIHTLVEYRYMHLQGARFIDEFGEVNKSSKYATNSFVIGLRKYF